MNQGSSTPDVLGRGCHTSLDWVQLKQLYRKEKTVSWSLFSCRFLWKREITISYLHPISAKGESITQPYDRHNMFTYGHCHSATCTSVLSNLIPGSLLPQNYTAHIIYALLPQHQYAIALLPPRIAVTYYCHHICCHILLHYCHNITVTANCTF